MSYKAIADILADIQPYHAKLCALEYGGVVELVTHTLHAGDDCAAWRYELRDDAGGYAPADWVERQLSLVEALYPRVCERAGKRAQEWMLLSERREEIVVSADPHAYRNERIYQMCKFGRAYRDKLLGRAYRRFCRAA